MQVIVHIETNNSIVAFDRNVLNDACLMYLYFCVGCMCEFCALTLIEEEEK